LTSRHVSYFTELIRRLKKLRYMLHFKASVFIFFKAIYNYLKHRHLSLLIYARETGKIVHRKISSFLHTSINSCPSVYIGPNSIFTSKFSRLMNYFWFPVNMKDTAAFPRKD